VLRVVHEIRPIRVSLHESELEEFDQTEPKDVLPDLRLKSACLVV
jgi:hypothetical protein